MYSSVTKVPFVIISNDPVKFCLITLHTSTISFRQNGSPPVNNILFTLLSSDHFEIAFIISIGISLYFFPPKEYEQCLHAKLH